MTYYCLSTKGGTSREHKGMCEGDCDRGNYKCTANWRQGEKALSLFLSGDYY